MSDPWFVASRYCLLIDLGHDKHAALVAAIEAAGANFSSVIGENSPLSFVKQLTRI